MNESRTRRSIDRSSASGWQLASSGFIDSRLVLAMVLLAAAIFFQSTIRRSIDDFLNFEKTDDATIVGRSLEISAKVGGVVARVFFDDHAAVKKGDVLLLLDTREFNNSVKQLQADLDAARALAEVAKRELDRGDFDNIVKQRQQQVEEAKALHSEAKSELNRGEFDTSVKRRKSDLAAAQALLRESKKELDRSRGLMKKGFISAKEYDAADANYQNNRAKVESLSVQLKEARLASDAARDTAVAKFKSHSARMTASVVQLKDAVNTAHSTADSARGNYRAAQAKVASVQAQLDEALLNLEYTVIRAPEGGNVGRRLVNPGMIIHSNQLVTTLVNSERWIIANFKETQIRNIQIGQEVEIEIDAIQGRTFRGIVQSISPGSGSTFALIPSDNATGNFTKIVQRVPVKISFVPSSIRGFERDLIPGISVNVRARILTSKKYGLNSSGLVDWELAAVGGVAGPPALVCGGVDVQPAIRQDSGRDEIHH
jgi:membrane fusion protein (multidrug efflux system)